MPFTENQRKILSTRVLADRSFRDLFLASPEKAAWKLGIILSAAESKELRDQSAKIRDLGKLVDDVLWEIEDGKYIRAKIIPSISVGDQSGDDPD